MFEKENNSKLNGVVFELILTYICFTYMLFCSKVGIIRNELLFLWVIDV